MSNSQNSLNSKNHISSTNKLFLAKDPVKSFECTVYEKITQGKLLKNSQNKKIYEFFASFKNLKTYNDVPKLIVIESEPYCGLDYLFKMMEFNPCKFPEIKLLKTSGQMKDGKEILYSEYINEWIENIPNQDNSRDQIIVFQNFMIDLFLDVLKEEYKLDYVESHDKNNFASELKLCIQKLKKRLENFLISDSRNLRTVIIFYWEDGEQNLKYKIKKLWGEEFLNSKKIEFLKFYAPDKNTMLDLAIRVDTETKLSIKDLNDIVSYFNGNLLKMKMFFIANFGYHNTFLKKYKIEFDEKIKTSKTSSKHSRDNIKINYPRVLLNKEPENVDFFHSLGKILYNKRQDPVNPKKDIKPTKNQYNQKLKFYFDIKKLLEELPDRNIFNSMLIYNAPSFFKDIKETAKCWETFSFTDKFSNFKYNSKYLYEDPRSSLGYLKIYLNSLAYMVNNKSQYGEKNIKKGGLFHFQNYPKETLDMQNQNKIINGELYMQAIKFNPSLAGMGKKRFMLDVQPIFKIIVENSIKKKNKNLKNTINISDDAKLSKKRNINLEEEVGDYEVSDEIFSENPDFLKFMNDFKNYLEFHYPRYNFKGKIHELETKINEYLQKFIEQLPRSFISLIMQNPNEFKSNVISKINNQDSKHITIQESDPAMEFSQEDLEKLFDDPEVRDSLVNSQQYISQNFVSQQDNTKIKFSQSKFYKDEIYSISFNKSSQFKKIENGSQQSFNEDPFEGMTEQDFQSLIKEGFSENQ